MAFYVTYDEQRLLSSNITGLVPTEGATVPIEPYIIVNADLYKRILEAPNRARVEKGKVEFLPAPKVPDSYAHHARISAQRQEIAVICNSGIVYKGRKYDSCLIAQTNYNASLATKTILKHWCYDIASKEWVYEDVALTDLKKIVLLIQNRRESLSTSSHLSEKEHLVSIDKNSSL